MTQPFYENLLPIKEEIVMVSIETVGDMGVYVKLLEYGSIEGMILLSELSRRRIRSINKLAKVGDVEPAVVVNVSIEAGYIDLSKKRVTPADMQICKERFSKSKQVNDILKSVLMKTNGEMKHLYEKIVYPMHKRYGHALDGFRVLVGNPDKITLDVSQETRDTLIEVISKRMVKLALKAKATFEITCFTEAGIEAIREALIAGEATSTEICPITISLITSPLYSITTMNLDKETAILALNDALKAIRDRIWSLDGTFRVETEPHVVSADEEAIIVKPDETEEANESE
jgi:translation initiation factor 2 subunit 1